MCDHDHDDEAPNLQIAASRPRLLRSDDVMEDVIQFDVSGATLVELRDAARKVLRDLLADAGTSEIRVTLEIAPDEVQELGDVGPVSWQAIVTGVMPWSPWLRMD